MVINVKDMEEEWKNIRDYEGLYMISSYGRVKSIGRWIDCKNKRKFWKEEKILKPSVDGNGYLFVVLSNNRKLKFFKVHRLVYEAFYGRIPQGMQVNHINEIKSDNRLENLNLMTPKENSNWGTRNKRVSEKQINGKYSKIVLQINKTTNEVIAEYPSLGEVERQLGFSSSNISKCCKGKQKQSNGFKWQYKNG